MELKKMIDTSKTDFNGENFWDLYSKIMHCNGTHPSLPAFRKANDTLCGLSEKEKASIFVMLGLFYANDGQHWR